MGNKTGLLDAQPSDFVGNAPVHGGNAVQVTSTVTPVTTRVTVSADKANPAGSYVYFGFSATTIDQMSIFLGPSDGCDLEIDDLSKLYVNSDTDGLKYRIAVQ